MLALRRRRTHNLAAAGAIIFDGAAGVWDSGRANAIVALAKLAENDPATARRLEACLAATSEAVSALADRLSQCSASSRSLWSLPSLPGSPSSARSRCTEARACAAAACACCSRTSCGSRFCAVGLLLEETSSR